MVDNLAFAACFRGNRENGAVRLGGIASGRWLSRRKLLISGQALCYAHFAITATGLTPTELLGGTGYQAGCGAGKCPYGQSDWSCPVSVDT
jgi:hypothetical protein